MTTHLNTQGHYLECYHCGCEAIENPVGIFCQDEGEKCMTCGLPGHVDIVEITDERSDAIEYEAEWICTTDEKAFCNQPDCDDCKSRGRIL
jgi:hypothetical protein